MACLMQANVVSVPITARHFIAGIVWVCCVNLVTCSNDEAMDMFGGWGGWGKDGVFTLWFVELFIILYQYMFRIKSNIKI
jgi:hypothetical protein